MHIIRELKGEDYNVFVLGDVIRSAGSIDPHDWFSDFNQNFNFKNEHKKYRLRQYGATDQVFKVVSEITDDLKSLFGQNWMPPGVRPAIGVQELKLEENDTLFTAAVPPHIDNSHFCGLTIFLNKHWEAKWGGWNYIISEAENRVVLETVPQYNVGVLIYAPSLHGACPVWFNKSRRTLQIFYTYEK